MQIRTRILWVLVAVALSGGLASAQSLTFSGGGNSRSVSAGRDFASVVIGDAWDMAQSSDHVFMFSSGWQSGPSVSSGRLAGTASSNPLILLQFEGVNGGLNVIGRNGVVYPIDPYLYNRISYRLSWNATPPAGDTVETHWFQSTERSASTFGGRLGLSYGWDGAAGRYVNQSPVSSQSAPGYHIFKRDLDTTDPAAGRTYGTSWTQSGVIRGLGLRLAGSVSGYTIAVDWVRLSRRGAATVGLAWSGFGGAVTLTAVNSATGDTVQIFPDDGSSTATFADNSSFNWDCGFLPAGTWVVTVSRGATTRQVTLTIKERPDVALIEPDASGGEDFVTATVGDPWDLVTASDVSRWGLLWNLTGATFGATGLHATSVNIDPSVYLLGDPNRALVQTIDASKYRNLTFTIEYDRKDYKWDGSLGFQRDLGGVARVIWQRANSTSGLTNTQDLIVMDGGPRTYSMDLASFDTFCSTALCELEPGHGTDLWAGRIWMLRIDPFEPAVQQGFRLANVKVAADDAPDASGYFLVRWAASDPASMVSLYYDTNTNPSDGRTLIVVGNLRRGRRVQVVLSGVPLGRYWICAETTDSLGASEARYSSGPLTVSTAIVDGDRDGLPDAWEVQFGLNPAVATGSDGPTGDADGDGRTNLQEYQDGTHPRGTFTRYFAEGATSGFFDCRIALLNPSASATARVLLRFLRTDGTAATTAVTMPPLSRRTVEPKTVPGMATAEFSTVVEADGVVVADRTLSWDAGGYGSHSETAVTAPSTVWYLAEGATNWNFDLWYLIQNPNLATDALVEVTYLRPAPAPPLVRQYVVAHSSRYNIYVDGVAAELAATDVSAVIRVLNGVPVIVERALYLSRPGQFWAAGHNSAGVTAPATDWFLAEGATGSYFDLYYLLCNPGTGTADVEVTAHAASTRRPSRGA